MVFSVLLGVEYFHLYLIFGASRSIDVVDVFQIGELELSLLLIIFSNLSFFLVDSLLEFYFPFFDFSLFDPPWSICKGVILVLLRLKTIFFLVGLL